MIKPEDTEYMNYDYSKKYASILFMKNYEQRKIYKEQTLYGFSCASKDSPRFLHDQRLRMYLDRVRHSREEYWTKNRKEDQIMQSFFFAEENERCKFLEQEASFHQITPDEFIDNEQIFIEHIEALENEQNNYLINRYMDHTFHGHH
ncbi:hypothetical protein T552_02525 [Pneumocystis carinii B80]|uniref:Uncharacterized protein n=1 Tax=Pneumocystis carinii (strain B80) TaxID=1408658 RepID=A0A0W4ZF93_PNEC8|nr:hypothetical protein T552_02525 [Pneumocystis carinii B80]KTW27033.1 hypothetical protein T552_02525 [Pneumocystis carinii B80]